MREYFIARYLKGYHTQKYNAPQPSAPPPPSQSLYFAHNKPAANENLVNKTSKSVCWHITVILYILTKQPCLSKHMAIIPTTSWREQMWRL